VAASIPYRIAAEILKAQQRGTPASWRHLGTLIDRNFDDLANHANVENVSTGRVSTTDATPTAVWSMNIPPETTVLIDVAVVARRTGGSAGTAEDGAGYQRLQTFKNVAGVATGIGLATAPVTNEDQPAWTVAFSTGINDQIDVLVTGAANNNISWYAVVRTFRVSS
jgi:hypothetical protein